MFGPWTNEAERHLASSLLPSSGVSWWLISQAEVLSDTVSPLSFIID